MCCGEMHCEATVATMRGYQQVVGRLRDPVKGSSEMKEQREAKSNEVVMCQRVRQFFGSRLMRASRQGVNHKETCGECSKAIVLRERKNSGKLMLSNQ